MQLSTASIVANLKEAFSKGKSGIIKNKPVLYKDKKGKGFTGDSLVVSCQNCAWLKILIQGKKARPHNYCSIMRKKVRTYDYCSRFKETKV